MKKSLRKLSLSRETLRTLDQAGLGHAAGAAQTDRCVTADTCTGDTCDCTLSCPELCQVTRNLVDCFTTA